MATDATSTQAPHRHAHAVTVVGEWARLPVHTRWLQPGDDLADVLRHYLPALHDGDTVVISEKVVVLLTGRTVSAASIRPNRLARALARKVRPRPGSCGLSVPEKMEYVRRSVGTIRLIAATAGAALTRPLGIHGVFYRVAGPVARDIDGARPPYEHLLFPPLTQATAAEICDELQRRLDTGVAIVDVNDYGGTIRAVSSRALPARRLLALLADNPLGQRSTGTPFAVVRPRRNA